MSKKLDDLNNALYRWKREWWCSTEYLELLENVIADNLFLWEDVADRQEILKQEAVDRGDYIGAQLHKNIRNYAQQSWHMNPLDQTDEWWAKQSKCILLLCDVEEQRVDWLEVFAEQNELMIQAGNNDDLDAAMFHQKLKQYAEEVFVNDESIYIRIPGQTGNE